MKTHGIHGNHHCTDSAASEIVYSGKAAVGIASENRETAISRNRANEALCSRPRLLVWSAADANAADRMVMAYKEFYNNHISGDPQKLDQLAFTLNTRRAVMPWRTYTVVKPRIDSASASTQTAESTLSLAKPVRATLDNLIPAFVFTGQGAQYREMGLELLSYPVFQKSLNTSQKILARLGCNWVIIGKSNYHLLRVNSSLSGPSCPRSRNVFHNGSSLRFISACSVCDTIVWYVFADIFGFAIDELRSGEHIDMPDFSQPLCTVLQIALVDLLSSFGIVPEYVVGHSSGEIGAAYCIGALSHESACKVAYYRGQVACQLKRVKPDGAMMAVNLAESEVYERLQSCGMPSEDQGRLTIACVNSTTNVTLSGPDHLIDEFKLYLDRESIFARRLNTGVSYHSPDMGLVAAEYMSLMSTLEPTDAETLALEPYRHKILMVSCVTGSIVAREELIEPRYWVDNLVSPVRFLDALERLVQHAAGTLTSSAKFPPGLKLFIDLIEVGPHAALRRPIRDIISSPIQTSSTIIRYHSVLDRDNSPAIAALQLLGNLFCLGYPVSTTTGNLQAAADNLPFLVDCPPYPFDHGRRYWSESRISKEFRLRPKSAGYLLGRRAIDSNRLQPRWRNWLSTKMTPWLGEHVVRNIPFLPFFEFTRSYHSPA